MNNTMKMGKCGCISSNIWVVKGDTRSQIVTISVPRMEGGVDLSNLAWYIKIENAAKVTDICRPEAGSVVISDDIITFDWLICGIATAFVGTTRFAVEGVDKTVDGHPIVWRSAPGAIYVSENLDAEISNESEADLSNLQKLIVYVNGELDNVIAAGKAAAESASAAVSTNQSIKDAESKRVSAETQRASEWAEIKSDVESSVGPAVASASAAAQNANTAAENANSIVPKLCTPFEASGSVVTCHPVEGYPLGVVSRIDAVQEGTGDPAPDNVRVIAGWDSVQLVQAGYQMIKSITEVSNDKMSAVANEDRTAFTITSLIESTYCMARFITNSDMLSAGNNYTIRAKIDGVGTINYRLYVGSSMILQGNLSHSNPVKTFVSPQDAELVLYFCATANVSYPAGTTTVISNVMLEETGTVHDTYTAELPETVYGGTLDWTTGVLTVDRAIATLDGTENYSNNAGWANKYAYAVSNILIGSVGVYNYTTIIGLVCSHVKEEMPSVIAGTAGKIGIGLAVNNTLLICLGDYASDQINDYIAEQYAAGTPIRICYKLADPYTIQLTPQQILAISGTNTLYTDSGDTTVSGPTDTVWLTQQIINAIVSLGGDV